MKTQINSNPVIPYCKLHIRLFTVMPVDNKRESHSFILPGFTTWTIHLMPEMGEDMFHTAVCD